MAVIETIDLGVPGTCDVIFGYHEFSLWYLKGTQISASSLVLWLLRSSTAQLENMK